MAHLDRGKDLEPRIVDAVALEAEVIAALDGADDTGMAELVKVTAVSTLAPSSLLYTGDVLGLVRQHAVRAAEALVQVQLRVEPRARVVDTLADQCGEARLARVAHGEVAAVAQEGGAGLDAGACLGRPGSRLAGDVVAEEVGGRGDGEAEERDEGHEDGHVGECLEVFGL